MNKYNRAKIYKIVSYSNPEIPPYYGSTVQSLAMRLGGHRKNYKRWLNGKTRFVSSFKLLECEEYHIELVEEVCCENKDQLRRVEGKYIMDNECVNKCVAGRTMTEYYRDNKEKINEKCAAYYQKNKEKQAEKILCGCGSTFRIYGKARHERTKKHQIWLSEQEPSEEPPAYEKNADNIDE